MRSFSYFLRYYLLDDEEITPKSKGRYSVKVKCSTTNQTFDSIRQAERLTGVKASNIAMVLKGAATFAGRDHDGKKMEWQRIV